MANDRDMPDACPRAPMRFRVRQARTGDAAAAAAVLRASITILCLADHGNDPQLLACWLANKTPGNVRAWIEGPGRFVVAEERGRVVGVGVAAESGEIVLNYVHPEDRFRGVSKAVLISLEMHLRAQGLPRSTLFSTRTAHEFYRAMGYVDAGRPHVEDGLTAYFMLKDLSAPTPAHDAPSRVSPSGG